jgi:hypothetical protein
VVEIVPTVEFPSVFPFTLQVTPVSLAPLTVAVNFAVRPTFTCAVAGDTETVTDDFEDPELHPANSTPKSINNEPSSIFLTPIETAYRLPMARILTSS